MVNFIVNHDKLTALWNSYSFEPGYATYFLYVIDTQHRHWYTTCSPMAYNNVYVVYQLYIEINIISHSYESDYMSSVIITTKIYSVFY